METLPHLLGWGLYPIQQAARLVGVEARSVRRWLRGYSWKYRDGYSSSGPLWALQYADDEELGHEQVLGFRDLLELRAVARFIEHGVPLVVIRATIEAAQAQFGAYPLHRQRFLTDGKRIFLDAVERATGARTLLDVKGRQFVFDSVIRPSLYEGIEYRDGNARRWFPVSGRKVIVLDPGIQFGEPIIADAGVPTDAIAAAVKAEGGDRKCVARQFRITPTAVNEAVKFENRLAA